MKFIGENPEGKYRPLTIKRLKVYIQQDDFKPETVKHILAFCLQHGFKRDALFKASALFYLRGTREKSDYDQVLVGILEVFILPLQLYEIVHCLSFWNQEGRKMFALNKVADQTFREFILKCIAADCRAMIEPWHDLFITGKGGNHIWIADRLSGERIFLIHFPDDGV